MTSPDRASRPPETRSARSGSRNARAGRRGAAGSSIRGCPIQVEAYARNLAAPRPLPRPDPYGKATETPNATPPRELSPLPANAAATGVRRSIESGATIACRHLLVARVNQKPNEPGANAPAVEPDGCLRHGAKQARLDLSFRSLGRSGRIGGPATLRDTPSPKRSRGTRMNRCRQPGGVSANTSAIIFGRPDTPRSCSATIRLSVWKNRPCT